jgi:hypothetical protein
VGHTVVHEVLNRDGAQHVLEPADVVGVSMRGDGKVYLLHAVSAQHRNDVVPAPGIHECNVAFRRANEGRVALADFEENEGDAVSRGRFLEKLLSQIGGLTTEQ